MKPTLGRIVIYRTDGRNGLVYDLPAIVTCTKDSHPGDYPDGRQNPLPVPESDEHVHLTVFTPGGYGTTVKAPGHRLPSAKPESEEFVGGTELVPGSGSYVEWNVPRYPTTPDQDPSTINPPHRSWRWPERV